MTYTEEYGKDVYEILYCQLSAVNIGEGKFLYFNVEILDSSCVVWTLTRMAKSAVNLICLYSFFVTKLCSRQIIRVKIYFFVVSATTHVESWLSRQLSSILGGIGLVPSI